MDASAMNWLGSPDTWLPIAFTILMGVAMLIYVVLDGYDLGVGLLLPAADDTHKDRMIASIGPFWDANETWLVLGIGLLLVAFPQAHGVILTALYLPVSLMLLGLILRGVAFEFRAKAPALHKAAWNRTFFAGSLLASLCQGFMLGLYIMGLEYSWTTLGFASATALCLTVAYVFIGAAWLLMKTEGVLQQRAAAWARRSLAGVVGALIVVSAATPLMSPRIFDRWFSMPELFFLAPFPIASALLVVLLWVALRHLPDPADRWTWVPFTAAMVLFSLAFCGLAYSFYPYIVPDRLTIFEAASAPESLFIIFVGACIVLPVIGGYTALTYAVFRGKATELRYD